MGIDLNGAGGVERFSNTSWRKMLELAYEYGWKPAGIQPGWWVDPETGESIEQMCPKNPQGRAWEGMEYLERVLEAEPGDEELGSGFTDYLREFLTFCWAGTFLSASTPRGRGWRSLAQRLPIASAPRPAKGGEIYAVKDVQRPGDRGPRAAEASRDSLTNRS